MSVLEQLPQDARISMMQLRMLEEALG